MTHLVLQALTRRVVEGKPVVVGLDDPSIILKSVPDLSERKTPPPDLLDITVYRPVVIFNTAFLTYNYRHLLLYAHQGSNAALVLLGWRFNLAQSHKHFH